jgi:hypothetical protein
MVGSWVAYLVASKLTAMEGKFQRMTLMSAPAGREAQPRG